MRRVRLLTAVVVLIGAAIFAAPAQADDPGQISLATTDSTGAPIVGVDVEAELRIAPHHSYRRATIRVKLMQRSRELIVDGLALGPL